MKKNKSRTLESDKISCDCHLIIVNFYIYCFIFHLQLFPASADPILEKKFKLH